MVHGFDIARAVGIPVEVSSDALAEATVLAARTAVTNGQAETVLLSAHDLERLDWILGRIAALESTGPFAELGATRVQPMTDLSAEGVAAGLVDGGVISYAHLGGTCAMGPDGDPDAVLDARCRVRGVEGLRVVDASAMPVLPAGNTYLGCVMMAERAAQLI